MDGGAEWRRRVEQGFGDGRSQEAGSTGSLSQRISQSCDCDFGWAVEAEGNANGPDPAIDVELQTAKLIVAVGEEFSERWKRERADSGDSNLAAVSVAG